MTDRQVLRELFLAALMLTGLLVSAQKTPNAPSAPSGGSLTGLIYETNAWPRQPPKLIEGEYAFLCYTLERINSVSQPYIARPISTLPPKANSPLLKVYESDDDKNGKAQPLHCNPADPGHPLLMDRQLIIVLYSEQGLATGIRAISINLTTVSGTPLSPTPIRPSFGPSTTATNGSNEFYFFAWPNRLQGDTLPTLSLTILYAPPIPGDRWARDTIYPVGSIVTASNGMYYLASASGVSGDVEPALNPTPDLNDNDCTWSYYGPSPPANLPSGTTFSAWQTGTKYKRGSLAYDVNTHPQAIYTEVAADCTSKNAGSLSLPDPSEIHEEPTIFTEDSTFKWQFNRTYKSCPNAANTWQPRHPYPVLSTVCGPDIGNKDLAFTLVGPTNAANVATISSWKLNHGIATFGAQNQFVAGERITFSGFPNDSCLINQANPIYVDESNLGRESFQVHVDCAKAPFKEPKGATPAATPVQESSASSPDFQFMPNPPTPSWRYLGIQTPAAVGTSTPTDQTVALMNLSLPQVHSLYYYNLASGVNVTTIRSKSFAFSTPTNINNGTPIQTGSSLIIDPVITLTRYIWPFDAERKYQLKDLRPGISLSISLTSPASNFYFGGSSEIMRYIQLGYGFAVAKVSNIVPGAISPSNATTPQTSQSFAWGGYGGFTFNITGFIQGITGGNKGN